MDTPNKPTKKAAKKATKKAVAPTPPPPPQPAWDVVRCMQEEQYAWRWTDANIQGSVVEQQVHGHGGRCRSAVRGLA